MHPRDDDRVWSALSAGDEIEMEYAERNWGTTAYNEFRPIWGEETSFDLPRDLDSYIDAPLQIHVYPGDFARGRNDVSYEYRADNQILITVTGETTDLRLRQFYMPGWRLTVDGVEYPFEADDHFGLIEFQLPAGAHLVQLDYVGTGAQQLAAAISLASIGVCLLILRFGAASPNTPTPVPEPAIPTRSALLLCGGLIAFAFINAGYLQERVFRLGADGGEPVYMQAGGRRDL